MGPGPASIGDEWIPAGEQGSTVPCHGCAGPSNSLSTAEDKDTKDDEGLVLSQCLAACRECWAGGVGTVRAWLWLRCVPTRAQCWHIQAA